MIPLIRNVQNRQIHRDRNQIAGGQELEGEGMGSSHLMGTNSYFGGHENVLELDRGDGCTMW